MRYNFSVPLPQRLAGISYVGHAARLRLLLRRIKLGEPVVIGVLGGSITAGQGVGGPINTYVAFLERWLNSALPPFKPDSLPCPTGTQSSYVAACVEQHLPTVLPDLVLVEFAVNDLPKPSSDFKDPGRRAFERLLRKLLQLPSRPAVVLVNMYAHNVVAPNGNGCCNFWNNAERDFLELGLYYGVPSISLKAAVVPSVLSNTSDALSAATIFNAGRYHPGAGGHVVAFELLVTLMQEVLSSDSAMIRNMAKQAYGNNTEAAAAALWATYESEAAQVLPPPLSKGNYEPNRTSCLLIDAFKDAVLQPVEGWEWTDEGRNKWGYVALESGQQLRIKVVYLRSYEGMGRARVTCEEGCSCGELIINAHNNDRQVSVAATADMTVSQAAECTLRVETLGPGLQTKSRFGVQGTPGSKFKLIGLLLGEDTGGGRGMVDDFIRDTSLDLAMATNKGT
ncbi:hypothetical protein GPECTOR_141g699 [Gonium pectorale]|uniref:SGNH hydrolase-type esterase domain-containing protein n=1 Tax=Gonium pectorale TaxID=33097 RepID=A0A150FY04_GONPE|nr:hypothetical protein GPECTOR_141g699 [Gonium pectorale]|eukprot:KXZ42501.1 hypothetical protein GPECTOR_141g699 [Gonium pectorale]